MKKNSVLTTSLGMIAFIAAYAVRDDNGAIDEGSTQVKFDNDLQRCAAEERAEDAKLETGLDQAFDEIGPKRVLTAPLVSLVMTKCGIGMDQYNATKKSVQRFLSANGRFDVGVGRTGGVMRLATRDVWAEQVAKHAAEQVATPALLESPQLDAE